MWQNPIYQIWVVGNIGYVFDLTSLPADLKLQYICQELYPAHLFLPYQENGSPLSLTDSVGLGPKVHQRQTYLMWKFTKLKSKSREDYSCRYVLSIYI